MAPPHQRDSSDPGSVSNPVWRIAVLALDVPSPTSPALSTTTHEEPEPGELAGDRAADDARADHHDVVGG